MNVKEVVTKAKDHIFELFADEGITDVGLEEVDPSDEDTWKITIGFSRPWDMPRKGSALATMTLNQPMSRTYKIVIVRDSDGEVLAVKNRDVVAA